MNSRAIAFPCLVGLGLVCATLLGCSGSADGGGVAGADSKDDAPHTPPSVPDLAESAADTSASEHKDTRQPDSIDGKTDEAQLAYRWHNPNRSQIFIPPTNKPAAATITSRDDHGVSLIGFANVDRQQVLLRIDGVIASLTVGDSRGELQVLAIDPPKVTLKRANREWTVKLFDTPD